MWWGRRESSRTKAARCASTRRCLNPWGSSQSRCRQSLSRNRRWRQPSGRETCFARDAPTWARQPVPAAPAQRRRRAPKETTTGWGWACGAGSARQKKPSLKSSAGTSPEMICSRWVNSRVTTIIIFKKVIQEIRGELAKNNWTSRKTCSISYNYYWKML